MRPGVGEQPYLVDELLPSRGIVVIWGSHKSFKSFVTLDIMFHIAGGRNITTAPYSRGQSPIARSRAGMAIESGSRHYGATTSFLRMSARPSMSWPDMGKYIAAAEAIREAFD